MNQSIHTEKPDAFDIFLSIQLKIAIAILGTVTLSFLLVPLVVLPLVNRMLKNMPGFSGRIRSMRLNLFKSSVTLYGLSIVKKNQLVPVAFFTQDAMTLSLRVYKRRLLMDAKLNNFTVNLVKGMKEDDSQLSLDQAWIEMAKKLLKFNISRLHIENGSTHFRTYHTRPQVDIVISNIKLQAEKLNIRSSEENLLPADIKLSASIHGGSVFLDGKLNPRNPVPTFDLNMELKGLRLEEVNNALLAYADVDVSRGIFSMSAELAAKKRKISGYIKPAIQDVKLFNWKSDKRSSLKKIAKELFLDGVLSLFKNHKSDQVATKIVIDGEINGPEVRMWSIVGCMFFNAFVESLLPHVEDSVSIETVGFVDKNCNKKKEC